MRSRLVYAGFGVLATCAGLAAGHLVAALVDPASSPVLAVGSTVIDLTPTPVKEWAVARFGTNDKPILIASVLAGTLLLAGLAGVVARRRLALGTGVLALLVGAAGAAALTRPTSTAVDVLPAVGAGVAGVAALGLLDRLATERGRRGNPGTVAGSRRSLLVAAGLTAVTAAAGATGQRLIAW